MAVYNDAIVKVPVLRITKEPYEMSETADELLHGMAACRVDLNDSSEYIKIRTLYNYEGWCQKNGLVTDEWNVRKYRNAVSVRIRTLSADVMEERSIKSRVIFTLFKGSLAEGINKFNDGWTEIVLADKRHGYVRTSALNFLSLKEKKPEDIRKEIVRDAMMYLGTQYRWGGKSPMGIDCSGLTSMAYMNNGIIIHRDSEWSPGYGIERIKLDDASPGDLLYFKSHIALYLGDKKFIHSTSGNFGDGVCINSLDEHSDVFRKDLCDIFLYAGRKIKLQVLQC